MNLTEERSTNIMELITDLRGSKFIEQILDVRGMTDGFTVLARGIDGNAYEIEIRPASFARGHEELRKPEKYAERKKKRQERLRKNMGL
jgi:hypothetical protein